MKILTLFAFIFCFSYPAMGRVFMFDQESIAPYLNLRTGVTSMGSAPARWQSADRFGGDDVDLVYGGEFGLYMKGMGFGAAFGILVHTFDPVSGGTGFSGATQLYTVDVEGIAYGPQVAFDYQFVSTKTYLWKFIVGGGYQFAKIENSYNFSAAGQVLVGGQTDLVESYKQEAPFALLAISTEFVMSGTTTVSVTAGYHYSLSQDWKYGQGGQNFAGAHGQGDDVLFEDSTSKTIDWSYPFLQVGFQFYVDTVR